MKTIGLMIVSLCLLAIIACEKKEERNCRPDTYGIYTGSNGLGGTFEANLKEGAGEKGLIIVLTNKGSNGSSTSAATVTGELNESCNSLTISNQQVGTQNYSGNLVVSDTKLAGTITAGSLTFPVSLTKQ